MKYQQICYTRLNDIVGGTQVGFTTFNSSPDIPEDVVEYFKGTQSGNQGEKWPIDKGQAVVWQFVADEKSKTVFNTRVLFDTALKDDKDKDSRGTIFSHSFIFPMEDFIRDPQSVLNVDDSNYGFDRKSTETIPQELVRTETLSLEECVESLGMDSKSYSKLVYAVYKFLTDKANKPLHIICDNSNESIIRYMVCIYAALPFEFRKKITFQSSNIGRIHTINRTIIFENELSNYNDYYIEPVSSENNFMTTAVEKKISKYDFIKIVPENYASGQNFDELFKAIANKLALFDSAATTKLELYKIAYNLLLDDTNDGSVMTPEDLQDRLYELLLSVDHPFIDRQIQFVLGDIIEYKFDLSDAIAEVLGRKLAVTEDRDLLECGYRYNFGRISRMDIDEGVKYLNDVYGDRTSEAFIQIRSLLNEDDKGKEILSRFYTKYVAAEVVADRDNIIAFYDETKDLADRSKVVLSIENFVRVYLKAEVELTDDPKALLAEAEYILSQVLADQPDMCAKILEYVKLLYWNNLKFENISFAPDSGYEGVRLDNNKKCNIVFTLIDIFEYFKNSDIVSLAPVVNTFKPSELGLGQSEYAVAIQKLHNECIAYINAYGDSNADMDRWILVSLPLVYIKKSPASFLIDNNIVSVCENFEEAYLNSAFLSSENNHELFKGWMEQYADAKLENSEIAAEILKTIKMNEKRIENERRQAAKEYKKAEKERAREEKELLKAQKKAEADAEKLEKERQKAVRKNAESDPFNTEDTTEKPKSIFNKLFGGLKQKKNNDDDFGGNED